MAPEAFSSTGLESIRNALSCAPLYAAGPGFPLGPKGLVFIHPCQYHFVETTD